MDNRVEELVAAAESGIPEAQQALAICYLDGIEGFSKCVEKAIEWYTKAAEQGLVGSQFMLGFIYERFEECLDFEAAKYWYNAAASQGHEKAKEFLQYMLTVDGIIELKNDADNGDLEAQYLLGKAYFENEAIRDLDEAMYWLNIAVQRTNKIKHTRIIGQLILLIAAPLTAFGLIYDGLWSFNNYKEYIYIITSGVISLAGYKMAKYKHELTENIPSAAEIKNLISIITTELNTNNAAVSGTNLQEIKNITVTNVPRRSKKPSSKAASTTKTSDNQKQRQVPGHIKMCLTCDYWGGQRNVNTYQKMVSCMNMSDQGKCNNLKCGFRNQKMPAGSGVSCNYYEKWGPIR